MFATILRQMRLLYPLVLLVFGLVLAACAVATSVPQTAPASTQAPQSPAATMPPSETTDPGTAAIFGWVFHDVCAVKKDASVNEVPEGCVPAKDVGLVANGVKEDMEPVIAGVTVRLGAGECPATGVAEITTIDTDISYSFTSLIAGIYCVSIDATESTNKDILLPGWWTTPVFSDAVASTTVTLAPGEAKYDVNFGWDYQLQPQPGDTSKGEAIMNFEAQVLEMLSSRDFEGLQSVMGDEFTLAYWLSEGNPLTPAEAIEQLASNHLGAGTQLEFLPIDYLAGEIDAVRSLFGEEVVRSIYVRNWGLEGKDEAVIYLSERADGRLIWRGVLVAWGGFAGERVPEGGIQIAPDTYFTEIDYVQTVSSVPVYSGDPNAAQPVEVGTVEAGQLVKVTGIRQDERWWRVVCPDDKLGDCWITADESVARVYMMMPGTQIAPNTIFVELSYLQALQTVPVYSGDPGDTSNQVAEIPAGQTALITGGSADGRWWRVICPDDSFGMCWVTVDPELVFTLELPPH